jgi:hypothetical protein
MAIGVIVHGGGHRGVVVVVVVAKSSFGARFTERVIATVNDN